MLIVEVIELNRILDLFKLMTLDATYCDIQFMVQQKYPKSRMSIRI
jgi:hypothetical protein